MHRTDMGTARAGPRHTNGGTVVRPMIVIACRDTGIDCDYVARAHTAHDALARFMEHVRAEHTTDWFELEEINARAQDALRETAA